MIIFKKVMSSQSLTSKKRIYLESTLSSSFSGYSEHIHKSFYILNKRNMGYNNIILDLMNFVMDFIPLLRRSESLWIGDKIYRKSSSPSVCIHIAPLAIFKLFIHFTNFSRLMILSARSLFNVHKAFTAA